MQYNRLFALISALMFVACASDDTEPAQESDTDVCEEAARHQEKCLGEYFTPPICDDSAAANAREMLKVSCDEFDAEFSSAGKADGAFCDWFNVGCTPDEPLFGGPMCASDSDCESGSFCVESQCFAGVESDEFSGIMELFTGTPEESGSLTQVLDNNEETRALRRTLVEQAEDTIHFSAFIIENDEVGQEMAELFADAAQRGVRVRVLIDATTQWAEAKYRFLEIMRDAGVEILPYNAITEWAGLRLSLPITPNDRLHEKMLIVDGQRAIMGGRNVGGSYLNEGRWRDVDVYIEGPGVAGVQRLFAESWDKNAAWEVDSDCSNQSAYGFYCPQGEVLSGDESLFLTGDAVSTSQTRTVFSDPASQETPSGYFTVLALVRSARESITISNAYFIPPQRLRKHLKAAARRGVDVTVITNSNSSTDAWWTYYAGLNFYKELIEAGVEIREYRGTETLHSKILMVDDKVSVIGSYNLDPRSAVDNTESMMLIRDGEAVQELRKTLVEDIDFSDVASKDIPFSELAKARSLRIVEPFL